MRGGKGPSFPARVPRAGVAADFADCCHKMSSLRKGAVAAQRGSTSGEAELAAEMLTVPSSFISAFGRHGAPCIHQ